jgi:hypothetical protein
MNFVKGASRAVLTLAEIERRRIEIGVSVDSLCAEARVSARGYYNGLRGNVTQRRLTRSKLSKALARLSKEGLEP